jgi:hypothetical protein
MYAFVYLANVSRSLRNASVVGAVGRQLVKLANYHLITFCIRIFKRRQQQKKLHTSTNSIKLTSTQARNTSERFITLRVFCSVRNLFFFTSLWTMNSEHCRLYSFRCCLWQNDNRITSLIVWSHTYCINNSITYVFEVTNKWW